MKNTPLTQEAIDGHVKNDRHSNGGFYATAIKHPVLTGSVVLAGAGLAYAAARMIKRAESRAAAGNVHVDTSAAETFFNDEALAVNKSRSYFA